MSPKSHDKFKAKSNDKSHDHEDEMKKCVHGLIDLIGEDPKREGLKKTPERYAKALKFLTAGYEMDPKEIVRKAMFTESYSEMVIVKDIEVFSLCEHHMLPFYGRAHIAYIPNGKIVGLSKIPRVVNCFARRLQVQERLTNQISTTLNEVLHPLGVGVVIEAYHLCMMMRGVEKQSSYTITSSMLGTFHEDRRTRQEFMSLISRERV
ncbi:MAG: GTP cyclohydrolase I FolE [Deltaproteobacteria bacterium]|nr:GTP cyclohydrolase I FolE [Deltaproteobacteria bacterium]